LRKRMGKRGTLTCDILADVLKNNSLPTPAELANNFVSHLGGWHLQPYSSTQGEYIWPTRL
jgi:hypothetical protein